MYSKQVIVTSGMLEDKLKTAFKKGKRLLTRYAKGKYVEADQADTYYLNNISADKRTATGLFAALQIKDGHIWLMVNANKAKVLLTKPELSHLGFYYRGNGAFRFSTWHPELEPGIALLLEQLDQEKATE